MIGWPKPWMLRCDGCGGVFGYATIEQTGPDEHRCSGCARKPKKRTAPAAPSAIAHTPAQLTVDDKLVSAVMDRRRDALAALTEASAQLRLAEARFSAALEDAHEAGASVREMARHCHLRKSRVAKLVQRE